MRAYVAWKGDILVDCNGDRYRVEQVTETAITLFSVRHHEAREFDRETWDKFRPFLSRLIRGGEEFDIEKETEA